jgi:hypothetical protein
MCNDALYIEVGEPSLKTKKIQIYHSQKSQNVYFSIFKYFFIKVIENTKNLIKEDNNEPLKFFFD